MALITSFSCFSETQAGGGAGMLSGMPGVGKWDSELEVWWSCVLQNSVFVLFKLKYNRTLISGVYKQT